MESNRILDKIIIFHKNGKIHHAIIQYQEINKEKSGTLKNDTIYGEKNFLNVLGQINEYYRRKNNHDFNIENYIDYCDYVEEISNQRKEK